MNILFLSRNLVAGDLALRLQAEGHAVKLYIADKQSRECFDGLVSKVNNWKKELPWVGKEGLIIFDDSGYGQLQEKLRDKGFNVVGGGVEADKIELDRAHGQAIFKKYGLLTSRLQDCRSIQEAINFVKENPAAWVIKRSGSITKQFHYIGHEEDGSDVIDVLFGYRMARLERKEMITLHKRIDGVEIGVGRYFNGEDWVGPIELNIEHPRLFPGNIGPITNEMGTLAWYTDNEENKLYQETLAKLKPYLQQIKFKGDFALNCIVNESGAYILEATPRFGSPIVHLQHALHESPWGELLSAVAKGEPYTLKYKRGFGIVILLAAPPFPYLSSEINYSSYGLHFSIAHLSEAEKDQLHFEEVSENDHGYYIARNYGFLMYVTAVGASVAQAQEKAYAVARKLNIPKLFYRNDIGNDFQNFQYQKLKDLRYLE
ncbi:MAG: hypothetical protein COU11_04175 [Candidatus Harrisonbacteria bacterium CG10_big_fil_rev_8_21_14_0_10_49_15]|uniref:Glycinamide ribonucleotide synthetase n=1 Tax=Candidatus Harrisonbacteria bacterium CG10_big_fil_rev_8_21_14_0_10_49_15 TaxID=1974587 RepID=A0A2H0UJV4_9BACT|nr:MAG: hypothetical protein COU11_04175 [Candidatus Harrisonbacteria bacterium CG10_big_fil_rev_8_21_14_0_10_49_15]